MCACLHVNNAQTHTRTWNPACINALTSTYANTSKCTHPRNIQMKLAPSGIRPRTGATMYGCLLSIHMHIRTQNRAWMYVCACVCLCAYVHVYRQYSRRHAHHMHAHVHICIPMNEAPGGNRVATKLYQTTWIHLHIHTQHTSHKNTHTTCMKICIPMN